MITREELLKSPEYWFEHAQNDLYGQVVAFMEKEGINQSELAVRLGVTKGYVSQILKGEFNYTLKKLIELSLAIGKVAKIEYLPMGSILEEESKSKYMLYAEHGEREGFQVMMPSNSQGSMVIVRAESRRSFKSQVA
jgi:transcriptional regulator with XRE-family HTH domain